ncbi:MAG: AAA family ATPase, partial [Sulfurovum sp.]|nr:AAA family ATPase [Sulfurovum sp.]NNJ45740.1 AAA family ATPase [Sulfurovum sp.]
MHKLTQHQEDVADEVLSNLRTHKTALLSGISGVGKTTTTEYIVSKYQRARKQVWLAATTHKALEVLSKMMPSVNSTRISTLHSFLNMIPDKSGPNRPMIVNPRGQTKFITLLVVDEYSMMTKDVIDALNDYRMMHDVDVLFVGDASQLILSKNDVDTLELDDKTSYLTEVMRQGRFSDIAIYSKMVSAFILGMGPEPIVPYGDEIIKYTD